MEWLKEVSGEWKFTDEKCATTATSNPSASGTREGIQQVLMHGGPNEAPRDVVETRKRGGCATSETSQGTNPQDPKPSGRAPTRTKQQRPEGAWGK